ncbi:hypothetical protein QJQ45_019818 [Haematococcus lacustris]|nr:hypothetical protein QJQ45_019818 [Haematococcus lacustris]
MLHGRFLNDVRCGRTSQQRKMEMMNTRTLKRSFSTAPHNRLVLNPARSTSKQQQPSPGLLRTPHSFALLQLPLITDFHRERGPRSLRPSTRMMATSLDYSQAATDSVEPLQVIIDNNSDTECTVITVEGKDQPHLLMSLSGAFTTAGFTVVSASIASDDGRVLDVFRVQTPDTKKLPESKFQEVKDLILSMTATSSRSGRPAIYGIVAAAEVERLRPLSNLSGQAAASEVQSLELTAAEMAQAAADLVAREREILNLRGKGVDARQLAAKESARQEAAAVLERKMSAMEALLVSRRTLGPMVDEKEEAAAASPESKIAAQMMEAMKPQRVGSGPGAGNGYEILLQAFNWESWKHSYYRTLKSQVKDIANTGFTSIWMPPPSDSVSEQGYLPRDLYCLDSRYGTEAELRDVIKTFQEHNIKVIADIVVNHRCASQQGPDGKWNKFGGRMAWDSSAICHNNPAYGGRGAAKQGDDYTAAPNVDHTQERVRNDIINWMKYLRNTIGYNGWRFDFVRGYPGQFCKQYVDATVPEMSFGEYWDSCDYTDGVLNYNQDSHRQRTINWCDNTGGTSAAFDFTTKGILQEAVSRREYWRLSDSQGRPPGVIGMWPSRGITFIDNHDTGSTLNHWPFPSKHLCEGYVYIMTHPGTPCVFYDHFYQEKDNLRGLIIKLCELRKRHGLNSRSKVTVRKATADVYAATIDDKIAMKIGSGDWSPKSSGIKLGNHDLKLAVSGINSTTRKCRITSTLPVVMILAVRYGSAFQRVLGSAFLRTLCQASPDQLPLNNPILVKYNEHVAKGQLEADQNQLRVVQSLALLFNELLEYSQRVKEHSQKLEAYQARHAARVSEIQAAEVAQGPRAAPPLQQPGSSSGLGLLQGVRSWVASALQGGSAHSQGHSQGQGKANRQLSPEQQAKLDAARWAGQATRELGSPPPRPPPPRGRYIHGSVGSGKSLLMDLFYQEVASIRLGLHRRQHFNAAMLEIHQRMHQLDKRIAAEQSALAWADGQALGQAAQQEEGGSSPGGAEEEEDEQQQAARGASQGRHGLSRFWDQEPTGQSTSGLLPSGSVSLAQPMSWDLLFQVVKQKAAKRAVLAVKRHLRMSQPGRVKKEDLAAANSQSVLVAVSSFLSSQHGQVEEGGAGRLMDPEAVPILCLDEMQVMAGGVEGVEVCSEGGGSLHVTVLVLMTQISDVFSAIALKGLVESLTKAGGIFVCTSNRSPDELPRHGLHEVLFDHFIGTLHKHCEVVQLSSHTDYRKLLLDRDRAVLGDAPAGRPVTYLHPLGPDTHSQLQRAWATVCDQAGAEPAPISVPVAFGRSLTVLGCGGAAYVEFPALFAACTGPCDFIALANYFHTVFIANVGALYEYAGEQSAVCPAVRDQARRFITAIDELYNARTRLIVSAAAPPDMLFLGTGEDPIIDLEQMQFESAVEGSRLRRDLMQDGAVAPLAATPLAAAAAKAMLGGQEEQFAFSRAVSRLCEMQSATYLMAWEATRRQQGTAARGPGT